MPDPRQQQDLLLAPGEFVCTLDTTKGLVNVLVGPFQSGVSGNATPIIWDAANSKFIRMPTYEDAIQRFVSVKHGEYVELTNPSKNTEQPYPRDGNSNSLPELSFGQRVVIPGPANFALWPRQSHKVIPGHRLRTNQYLVARVHNDAEAQTNRDKAVEKKAVADKSKLAKPTTPATGEAVTEIDAVAAKPEQYTTGQLIIIKGTEVSFYIPQTGIEVVPDSHGDYVRDAVTLERMEFCILREERGERRYVQGPDVVFPSPTETFVAVNGEVKFKPIMLNNISGLYIQVIADYEEGGKNYKKGQELFITGQ
jgi:major vault protein